MIRIIDHPSIVFLVSLFAQWDAAYTGDVFRRWRLIGKNEREDFNTVLTATLTLLALIIGFSFSMAVSRYDQRKNNEEAEANAIGTEYARADLLPAGDGTKLRELLRRYVNQRILFYHGDNSQVSEAASEAQKLQAELWSRVVQAAAAQSTPVAALAVSGMNDVLNSQGYTGRVGEPHPGCGMDTDGIDCHCLQSATRLSGAECGFAGPSGRANCRINCVFSYRGYRQPARRCHSRYSS